MRLWFLGFLLIGLWANPASVIQKLADDPRDRPIQVRHEGAKFSDVLCYAPVFTKDEGYIYLDYCTSRSVKNARYDVFGRIGYQLDGKWLCLTAPSSVTGIDGASSQDWDYLVLRPCVINDKNQKWKIENNAIYTADKRFRIKDYKSYAYISKNAKDSYDHRLTGVMEDWIKRVARAMNISVKTPLSWLFINKTEWALYYVQNNKSTADVTLDLYYNPENGHLAQYYPDSGKMYCLTSNTTQSQSWNWASWVNCSDNVTKEADKARYWELFGLNNNEGMLRDYWGNILRVTSYGPNWGVPYAAKPEYLLQDTTNYPTSNFIFSHDIDSWNRFSYANLQDGLEYCPAPGGEPSKKRVKRDLPSGFNLTDAWIERLWQIATSTDINHASDGIGLCGICLLQSYQMAMELINFPNPLTSGGYFFNTMPNVSPFINFRTRYPELARRLEQTYAFANINYTGTDSFATRVGRAVYGMSIGMLPQYVLTPSAMVTSRGAILDNLSAMVDSPVGSLYLIVLYRSNATGDGVAGHAQLAMRLQNGLVVIPTNSVTTLEDFRQALTPLTGSRQVRDALTFGGQRRLLAVQSIRIQRPFNNPLSLTISQNNCTGEGDHRRGTRTSPSSALVNQCASGRCLQ